MVLYILTLLLYIVIMYALLFSALGASPGVKKQATNLWNQSISPHFCTAPGVLPVLLIPVEAEEEETACLYAADCALSFFGPRRRVVGHMGRAFHPSLPNPRRNWKATTQWAAQAEGPPAPVELCWAPLGNLRPDSVTLGGFSGPLAPSLSYSNLRVFPPCLGRSCTTNCRW